MRWGSTRTTQRDGGTRLAKCTYSRLNGCARYSIRTELQSTAALDIASPCVFPFAGWTPRALQDRLATGAEASAS